LLFLGDLFFRKNRVEDILGLLGIGMVFLIRNNLLGSDDNFYEWLISFGVVGI
jgi:hypothetical protein